MEKGRVLPDYHVINSGSDGNSVRIENLLIDIGIPFKRLKEELYQVDVIFITHAHYDHLQKGTYDSIRKKFPNIKVCGNYDVAKKLQKWKSKELDIITGSRQVGGKGILFTPFECVHDVPCQGLVIEWKDLRILYATDTCSLENVPEGTFDMFFLESNHDEKVIQALQKKNPYGYDVVAGALRHLSTQKAKAFYYTRRKDKDCVWIELHKSKRFY